MALKQSPQALQAPDGSYYVTLTDGAGALTPASAAAAGYATPAAAGVIVLQSSSGNVAAAAATAFLAQFGGQTTYLAGFTVTGGGATAGSIVTGTITGLLGGTQSFTIPVATGATVGNLPYTVNFNPALPASASNTAITVSVPSLGAGNTNSTVSAWGYRV